MKPSNVSVKIVAINTLRRKADYMFEVLPNPDIFKRLVYDLNNIAGIRELVLTLHLYIEFYLNWIMKESFDDPPAILNERTTFYSKMQSLKAIGTLKGELYDSIKSINSIRNNFAHKLFDDHIAFRENLVNKVRLILPKDSVHKQSPSLHNTIALLSVKLIIDLDEIYKRKTNKLNG